MSLHLHHARGHAHDNGNARVRGHARDGARDDGHVRARNYNLFPNEYDVHDENVQCLRDDRAHFRYGRVRHGNDILHVRANVRLRYVYVRPFFNSCYSAICSSPSVKIEVT